MTVQSDLKFWRTRSYEKAYTFTIPGHTPGLVRNIDEGSRSRSCCWRATCGSVFANGRTRREAAEKLVAKFASATTTEASQSE